MYVCICVWSYALTPKDSPVQTAVHIKLSAEGQLSPMTLDFVQSVNL
jgi:hypothetical protein